jgi:hypothetical protein
VAIATAPLRRHPDRSALRSAQLKADIGRRVARVTRCVPQTESTGLQAPIGSIERLNMKGRVPTAWLDALSKNVAAQAAHRLGVGSG